MRITEDVKLDFSDVLLVPKRSSLNSRSEVSTEREFSFKYHSPVMICCPVISSNMYNTGTLKMAEALNKRQMLCSLHKYYSVEDLVNNYNWNCIPSFGLSDYDKLTLFLSKLKELSLKREKLFRANICIDIPNGYIPRISDFIKVLRDTYEGDILITVGNVVTPNMTEQLILDGADIIKVGIGSGALCTTRLVAGVGYPQLSAVAECADAAHGLGGHIISDGGITCVGDICKAFCAGADFVMIGGMFMGYEENEGEWETIGGSQYSLIKYKELKNSLQFAEGRQIGIGLGGYERLATWNPELDNKWKTPPIKSRLKVFGMSSKSANEKFSGGLKTYRAAEGRETIIDYKGLIEPFLQEIEGGLRSCGTYIGAKRIKDFPKCANFIKVNNTHNRSFENGK